MEPDQLRGAVLWRTEQRMGPQTAIEASSLDSPERKWPRQQPVSCLHLPPPPLLTWTNPLFLTLIVPNSVSCMSSLVRYSVKSDSRVCPGQF